MRRKISGKLQLIYIALFFLIILTTVVLNYASSEKQLKKQVISSNQNVLSQISKRVDSTLQEIDLTVLNFLRVSNAYSFFENPASESPEYLLEISQLQDRLGSILAANFNMKTVLLYSKRSDKLVTPSSYASLEQSPGMEWIRGFTDGPKADKWSASPDTENGEAPVRDFLMIRYYPLTSGPSVAKGVVVTQVNEKSISSMFGDLQFGDSYNVFLVDRQGTILSHKDPSMIHQSIRERSYSPEVLAQEGGGYVEERTANGRNLIFYQHSSYSDWTLVYVVTQKQLDKLSLAARNLLIGIASLMALIAIGATVFINRRWFKPMEHFVVKLEELALHHYRDSGNERAPAPISYGDLQLKIQQVFTGYSSAEKQLHESLPALKLQMVFDMLNGSRTRFETAEPLLKHVGIALYPTNYIVLTMEFDNSADTRQSEDLHLYLYGLCNVAEEILGAAGEEIKGAAVQINDSQSAMILSFAERETGDYADSAKRFASRLKEYIKMNFKRTLCIGIGSHYEDFRDIRTSYLESSVFLSCKIVTGPDSLLTSGNAGNWDSRALMEVLETVDALMAAVKQADRDAADRLSGQLLAQSVGCNLSKDMLIQLYLQVVLEALRTAASSGLDAPFLAERETLLARFRKCETAREMNDIVRDLMLRLIAAWNEKRSSRKKTQELVEAIQAYIKLHYAQSDISVHYLADLFGITPNYLSKLFKEHAGSNFVDYLIEERMRAAGSLLLETPLKLNDIAEQVGYTNFSSFLRNFKKVYGMTPTEYRQMNDAGAGRRSAE
jgi:Response regulator containing CheY-like receiver domain and AraC-type DNA-binding domain